MTNNPQQQHDETGPFTYRDARRLLVLIVLLIAAWIVLSSLVPVLLLFGIVILLAMVLNPVVVRLERRRVPRPVSVALVLLGLLAIATLIIAVAVPIFADQLQTLVRRAPGAWQSIRTRVEGERQSLRTQLSRAQPEAIEGNALVIKLPNAIFAETLKGK